jgi:hypothetical protein
MLLLPGNWATQVGPLKGIAVHLSRSLSFVIMVLRSTMAAVWMPVRYY